MGCAGPSAGVLGLALLAGAAWMASSQDAPNPEELERLLSIPDPGGIDGTAKAEVDVCMIRIEFHQAPACRPGSPMEWRTWRTVIDMREVEDVVTFPGSDRGSIAFYLSPDVEAAVASIGQAGFARRESLTQNEFEPILEAADVTFRHTVQECSGRMRHDNVTPGTYWLDYNMDAARSLPRVIEHLHRRCSE